MDDPVVRLLLKTIEFDVPRTPKSKKMQVNYDKIIGGDLTQEVREMLQLGTQQRRLLVQGLSYAGTTPNPQNVIESVNAYLPSVWKIQKSLEYSKDTKIKVMAPLHFEWQSVLLNPERVDIPVSQAQGVFVYEVSFILVVRALSHFNQARALIQRVYLKNEETPLTSADPMLVNNFKEAINELRTGAGVLEFCADDVLVHWKKPPVNPLPENRPKQLKALAIFFNCYAQRIMIAKALLKAKEELRPLAGNDDFGSAGSRTVKTLKILPNMFQGLEDKYRVIERIFISDHENLATVMNPPIFHECATYASLSRILAFKYTAQTLAEEVRIGGNEMQVDNLEKQFGRAVAFAEKAVAEKAKFAENPLARNMKGDRATDLKNELMAVSALSMEYDEENKKVYYGKVEPEDAELDPRSQYRFVITTLKFVMPSVSPLSFEQIVRAPPGIDQNTFNAMPKEIQDELLLNHRNKIKEEEERKKEEEKQKKGGGLFGKNKKKGNKKDPTQVELLAPPGTDASVFAALPYDMKVEIVNDYNKNNSTK